MQLITSYTARFGRIRRRVWLQRLLCLSLSCTAFGMLAEWAFGEPGAAIVAFIFVWCTVAVSGQRLHDRGRSSWWLLGVLVPVIGPVCLLWQLLARGDKGSNAYGANPTLHADYLKVDITR